MGGHQAALAQRLALLVHNRIDDSPGALHVAAAGYIRLTQARLESVLEANLPSFEVRSLCSSSLWLPLQLLSAAPLCSSSMDPSAAPLWLTLQNHA